MLEALTYKTMADIFNNAGNSD